MIPEVDTFTMFTLTLQMGALEMDVKMVLRPEVHSYLHACFGEEDNRGVEPQIVPFGDVQEYIHTLYTEKLDWGRLFPGNDEVELAELADHLAHEDSFLTVDLGQVIILFFPSRGNIDTDEPAPDSTIGFEIRSSTQQDPEYPDDDSADDVEELQAEDGEEEQDYEKEEDEAALLLFKQTFGMDFEDLFKWPTRPNTVRKEVFLLMDDDREGEMEALSRLLRWAGAHVSTPEEEGAWTEFKSRNEGVVIVSLKHNMVCTDDIKMHSLIRLD